MTTPFEAFVNGELPKRVLTEASPTSWTPGLVLTTTGVALGVEASEVTSLGLEPSITGSDVTTEFWNGKKNFVSITAGDIGAIPATAAGIALGVATLDEVGKIPLSQIPASAIERVVVVADEIARFALAIEDVQKGDVVDQQTPKAIYFVVDDANLDNASGYSELVAGTAAAVAWSGITGIPVIISDIASISGSVNGDVLQRVAGTWVNRTTAQLKTSLAISTTDVSGLDTALGLKAPLESPEFTGTVTVPTATAGNSSTAAASTAFVAGEVSTYAQPKDSTLTALAAYNADGFVVQTDVDTFTSRSLSAGQGITILNPSAVSDNPTISITDTAVTSGTYGSAAKIPRIVVDGMGRITGATEVDNGVFSDSVFRLQDNLAPTKQLAFELSGITAGQTRTITMPDSNVDIGKVPTALSYSASSLTLTNTDGTTFTANIPSAQAVKKTGSFIAESNKTYYWDSSVAGAIAVTFPASPVDGDTIVIRDSLSASRYATSEITSLTITSTPKYIISNTLTSYDVLTSIGASAGCILLFRYSSASLTWDMSQDMGYEFNTKAMNFRDGTTKKIMQFDITALTTSRMVTFPDAPVNLGKIPASLSYNTSSGVLTSTALDNSTLTASFPPALNNITGDATLVPYNRYTVSGGSHHNLTLPVPSVLGEWIEILPASYGFLIAGVTLTVVGGISRIVYESTSTVASLSLKVESDGGGGYIRIGSNGTNWFVTHSGHMGAGAISTTNGQGFKWIPQYNTGTTRYMAVDSTPVTTARTMTLPDADVALGKIPTGISYSATTGIVTLANTDGTTSSTANTGAITDALFRIQSNTDATRKIGFSATSIAAGQTRTITMPNANVALGKVPTGLSYTSTTGVLAMPTSDSSSFTATLGTLPDTLFRIADNGDATKLIAFEAAAITTGQTRTITMPNADVNLGKVPTGLTYSATTGVLTVSNSDTSTDQNLTLPALRWIAIPANTDITLVSGFDYIATNTATGKTYTLPLAPSVGAVVQLKCNNFVAFNQTLARNSSTINGSATDLTLNRNGTYTFTYNTAGTWESSFEDSVYLDLHSISGTKARVVGGYRNTISGTNCVAINCERVSISGNNNTWIGYTAGDSTGNSLSGTGKTVIGGCGYATLNKSNNSITLGSSTNSDLFVYPVAAAYSLNALFCSVTNMPVSGVANVTIDGNTTLSNTNCLTAVTSSGGTASHTVEFIISVGADNGFGGCNTIGVLIATRKITVFQAITSGTYYVGSVQTVGTDTTLGVITGVFTPTVAVDTVNNRLVCSVTRTGGVAGQEAFAVSARTSSHDTR